MPEPVTQAPAPTPAPGPPLHLCRHFDATCFDMTPDQHEACAKSLPMVCRTTGEVIRFDPKDGHCPFEAP